VISQKECEARDTYDLDIMESEIENEAKEG
jgi:hypothetical protein